jgi:hypothetical protein
MFFRWWHSPGNLVQEAIRPTQAIAGDVRLLHPPDRSLRRRDQARVPHHSPRPKTARTMTTGRLRILKHKRKSHSKNVPQGGHLSAPEAQPHPRMPGQNTGCQTRDAGLIPRFHPRLLWQIHPNHNYATASKHLLQKWSPGCKLARESTCIALLPFHSKTNKPYSLLPKA